MASQPIGVFDSGLGGLTIALELLKQLPNERIVYFGDTAHLPYGDKSPSVLRGYVRQITDFLLSHHVKAIVIACNTASAVASDVVLEQATGVPVVEVISPTVQEALADNHVKRIGIIGTQTTIRSGVYRQAIEQANRNIEVAEKATPLLVPLIEEGWGRHPVCQTVLEAYLTDQNLTGIDSLILGCTHYPLIREQVESYYQLNLQSVQVIDSSKPAVAHLKRVLNQQNRLSDVDLVELPNRYYVSDLNQRFFELAYQFTHRHDFELREFKWKD